MANGMPLCSAKPMAAGTPESGTGMTRSASTGCSTARRFPNECRTEYTDFPNRTESGRAK